MSEKDKINKYVEMEKAGAEPTSASGKDTESEANHAQQPQDSIQVEETTEGNRLKEVEAQLEQAQKESQDNYDRLLRVSAEFDNYKKRMAREKEEYRKFANESLLKELLSVVDNLERAIDSSKNQPNYNNSNIAEGVGMTLTELLKILEKFHVKPIQAMHEPFDPSYHQAIAQEESDKHPENTVVSEVQKGYTIHDRLLRPAMVIVSKPSSQPSAPE